MGKVNDFLNRPMYQNMINFAKEYIYLSEIYWELTFETTALESIDSSYKKVLMDKMTGDKEYPLVKKSKEEIDAYFHQQRLNLYKKIPDKVSDPVKSRIDKLIKSYVTYATQFGLNIPYTGHLSTYQYYYNYVLLKRILPSLELKAEIVRKK